MEIHLLSWYSGVGITIPETKIFAPETGRLVRWFISFWGPPCLQVLLLLVSGMVSHFLYKTKCLLQNKWRQTPSLVAWNGLNLITIIAKKSMKFGFGLYKFYTVHHVFPTTHSTYNIDFCLHQTLKIINDMKHGQVFGVPPKKRWQGWTERASYGSTKNMEHLLVAGALPVPKSARGCY